MPSEFGTLLRATRLGYHKSEKHGGFVRARMSPNKGVFLAVDFAPFDKCMKSDGGRGEYVVWWDGEDVLDMSPRLRKVTNVNYPFTILLDEDGEEIKPDTVGI